MRKRMIAMAVAATLAVAAGSALAQQGGGRGGGGNGWHGGGNHGGHWQGGGYRGGHWQGGGWRGYRVVIGAPFWYWGTWPYYYPYYDPYYYYPAANSAPYPASYPGSSGSNAWYIDNPSGGVQPYPQSTAPVAAPQGTTKPPPPQTYRYYCPDAGYYPEVSTCAKGWLRVIPDSPPK